MIAKHQKRQKFPPTVKINKYIVIYSFNEILYNEDTVKTEKI